MHEKEKAGIFWQAGCGQDRPLPCLNILYPTALHFSESTVYSSPDCLQISYTHVNKTQILRIAPMAPPASMKCPPQLGLWACRRQISVEDPPSPSPPSSGFRPRRSRRLYVYTTPPCGLLPASDVPCSASRPHPSPHPPHSHGAERPLF